MQIVHDRDRLVPNKRGKSDIGTHGHGGLDTYSYVSVIDNCLLFLASCSLLPGLCLSDHSNQSDTDSDTDISLGKLDQVGYEQAIEPKSDEVPCNCLLIACDSVI